MKKLLILFFATSLFVACNNNKKDDRRSDRDRDRERDDYRSRDDEKENDRDRDRDADYNDDNKRKDDSYDKDDSRSTGWSAKDVRDFVSECVPAAAKNGLTNAQATDYCECMQQKIERQYPDINDAARIDMESPEMQQMVQDCAPRGN